MHGSSVGNQLAITRAAWHDRGVRIELVVSGDLPRDTTRVTDPTWAPEDDAGAESPDEEIQTPAPRLSELTAVPDSGQSGQGRRRRVVAPATGERNALVGYVAQYEYAAAATLASLRAETLQRLRLADVDAGQIDDFQLETAERVDAYQVKWSRTPDTIGFALIARDAPARVSFLRQLADAWQRLVGAHAGKRVVVHLVTNDVASTAAAPRDVMPRPMPESAGDWSLDGFLREAWGPATASARANPCVRPDVPERWRRTWAVAEAATGLAPNDFVGFLADCEIELGVVGPEEQLTRRGPTDIERRNWQQDVRALVNLFMRWVARGPETEMSRAALLAELGWQQRVQPRSVHEFPSPEIPYRSIVSTVGALEAALGRVRSGYVALLGSPGSGKSTLLTRTVRQLPDRVIRYYAYVPRTSNTRRGEALNFLHDVTLALHRDGVYVGESIAANEHELLSARFEAQLEQVHRDWVSSGRRTIILVDGLDHIEREQDPARSLLLDLPVPEAVPEGIVFVLGSQTDRLEGLSPRIREHLDQDGRRLQIGSLERADVIAIVDAAELTVSPNDGERERIFQLSGGHPLALNYIMNRLRLAPSAQVASVLDQAEPFAETIDTQYSTLWDRIHQNIELVRLLALLARMRDRARLEWIANWAPAQAVHHLTERLGHLFRRERGGRWAFFHNSFRAYVVRRTQQLAALGGDASLFGELASRCAATPSGQPEHSDEPWYRWRCGEHSRVLALSDRDVFLRQFLAGRSIKLIEEDGALGLAAAVELRDIVGITRQLLLASEIAQRVHYSSLLPLAELYLELREPDKALDLLGSETALWAAPEYGLSVSASLDRHGLREEATRVFSQAEPIAELRSVREHLGGRDEDDLLTEWIRAAPRFRAVAEILSQVDGVRAQGDTFHLPPASSGGGNRQEEANRLATQSLRFRLLQLLVHELDVAGRWAEADLVLQHLHDRADAGPWWFWTATEGWRRATEAGELAQARARLDLVLNAIGANGSGAPRLDDIGNDDSVESRLADEARVAIAEGCIRLHADAAKARRLIDGVAQPANVNPLASVASDGFRHFLPRYRLNRLLGALGDTRPPEMLVQLPISTPGASRERGEHVTATFECAVIRLARLEAASWLRTDDHSAFRAAARPILRAFDERSHLATGAYLALSARTEFFKRLVTVARAYGPQCVGALCEELEAEWVDETRSSAWPPDLMRDLLGALAAAGASAQWIARWLEHVEPVTFSGGALEEELPHGIEQARAWLAIGDAQAARRTLERVLSATFGNEYKDDQLAWWTEWAERVNRVDPSNAPQRLAQLAGAVASLEGSEAQGYVNGPLLAAGASAGARVGIALMRWCFTNRVEGWIGGAVEVLRGMIRSAPSAADTLVDFSSNLILPLANQAHYQLVQDLASHCSVTKRQQFANVIEASALGSSRPALRDAIAGRPQRTDDEDSGSGATGANPYATSFAGLQLTEVELRDRVQSVPHVRDLLDRLRSDAYPFRWEPLLSVFVDRASVEELTQLVDVIPAKNNTWKIHARIAERLVNVQSPASARAARRVIEASTTSGWSERFDGGSRLRGYELVVAALGHNARDEVWRDLFAALEDELISIRSVLANWTRIAALLAPQVDDVAIWQEISAHVQALVRHAPIHQSPLLPEAHDPTDAPTAREAITELAADFLDHPARALATGAQRFFVDRLITDDSVAQRTLFTVLSRSAPELGTALIVLRAVAEVDANHVAFADNLLRNLIPTKDYIARRDAEALRAVRGIAEPLEQVPTSLQRPLPAVFQIVHPPARFREPGVLAPGEMLPPAVGAADLVRLYKDELRIIANVAGVQPEALYEYVAQEAAADQGTPTLVDEEPAVRDEMAGMNLEIAYRRPRTRRIAIAMSAAVTMLIDRGWLAGEHFGALDILLRNADPWFLAHRPASRPSTVRPIREREGAHSVPQNWTASASIDDAATGVVDAEGWTVIAEETWLKWLDWESAVETRIGAVFQVPAELVREMSVPAEQDEEDPQSRNASAMDAVTADVGQRLVAEYAQMRPDEHMAIVRSPTFRLETPNTFWLALHPALARFMNWRPAADGLFRWTDADGRAMVESLWWQDGFAGLRPPEFHDEVGFGWLVRASPAGWQQLRTALGAGAFLRRVERSSRENPTRAIGHVTPARNN